MLSNAWHPLHVDMIISHSKPMGLNMFSFWNSIIFPCFYNGKESTASTYLIASLFHPLDVFIQFYQLFSTSILEQNSLCLYIPSDFLIWNSVPSKNLSTDFWSIYISIVSNFCLVLFLTHHISAPYSTQLSNNASQALYFLVLPTLLLYHISLRHPNTFLAWRNLYFP